MARRFSGKGEAEWEATRLRMQELEACIMARKQPIRLALRIGECAARASRSLVNKRSPKVPNRRSIRPLG